jgi:hypothetical protein
MQSRDSENTLTSMNAPAEPKPCRIEQSLGRTELCPGASCPLWDQGDNASGGGCLFDRLDLAGRRDLAVWLHDLREKLDTFGASDAEARRIFYERLNAGRSD